jgi:hypothetical protein
MPFRTAFKAIAIIVATGSITSIGNAQYTYTPPVYTPLQAITSDVVYEGMKSSSRDVGNKAAPEANTSGLDASIIRYNPQKSRTRANLQAFVDKTRAVDPAGAAQLEQLFASTDIIGEIGRVMANVGLSKNNAADAFAVYWIAAWQAAHGDTSTPSSEMAQAVAAQAARGLSQSPEFAAANDAQKQEMAEALLVQAALIDGSMDDAGSDKAKQQAVAKAVKQGAAASGLELDQMTLTEEGFVEGGPRKGADASGAVGEETKLAASAEAKDNSLTYSIMAALGLGAAFMIGKGMRKG